MLELVRQCPVEFSEKYCQTNNVMYQTSDPQNYHVTTI
jgi:hypothetical protein